MRRQRIQRDARDEAPGGDPDREDRNQQARLGRGNALFENYHLELRSGQRVRHVDQEAAGQHQGCGEENEAAGKHE